MVVHHTSVFAERQQLRRIRIEDGELTFAQCTDHDEVATVVKANWRVSLPLADPIRCRQQPLVEVPGEHEPVRHGVEDAIQLAVFIGRTLKLPEVSHLFGIEPRLNMREVTAANIKSGPQGGHEVDHHRRVLRTNVVVEIDAQAEIVIAPNADGLRLSQQLTCLLNPFSLSNTSPMTTICSTPFLRNRRSAVRRCSTCSWMSVIRPSFI